MKRARNRKVVDVVADLIQQWAILSPARHTAIDQFGISREARVGAETKTLHHARAKSFDQGVGLRKHAQHGRPRVRIFEINADGSPASIQRRVACLWFDS